MDQDVLGICILLPLLSWCFLQRLHLLTAEANDSQGDPLFLTPLIEENKILEAQALSRVNPDILDTNCFTGFFTVDQQCESNLFFWFCQAQTNWQTRPILLWLQGGPGGSSLYGLFREIGPFYYENSTAIERKHSWNANNNVLFIDQPVGTGFSFTRKGCYAENKNDIAKDLYSAITQFYKLFPVLKANNFYIAGESYGGHYFPYIGHYIHKMNPTVKDAINLKGMMIGNGWMDSYYQYDNGKFLFSLGLIDEKQKYRLHEQIIELRSYLNIKDMENASVWSNEISGTTTIMLGKINQENYFQDTKGSGPNSKDFVDFTQLRKAIHVGSQEFGSDTMLVFYNLAYGNGFDYELSVKAELEELLEHYPIVFYFGQLDTLVPYSVALSFLRELRWRGAADYQQASRRQWCVDGRLAGFYRSSHNLHEVLVRNAGHSVPLDQPLWAFIMADSVTSSPPDDPLRKLVSCERMDQNL